MWFNFCSSCLFNRNKPHAYKLNEGKMLFTIAVAHTAAWDCRIVAIVFAFVCMCVCACAWRNWTSLAYQLKRSIQSLSERYRESKLKTERSHHSLLQILLDHIYRGNFFIYKRKRSKKGNLRFQIKKTKQQNKISYISRVAYQMDKTKSKY